MNETEPVGGWGERGCDTRDVRTQTLVGGIREETLASCDYRPAEHCSCLPSHASVHHHRSDSSGQRQRYGIACAPNIQEFSSFPRLEDLNEHT